MWSIKTTVVFLSFSVISLGQRNNISSCEGSALVNENVSYSLNFLGKKNIDANNLFGYCIMPNISNNYIWTSLLPNSYGNLEFVIKNAPDSLSIFVFECATSSPCTEIREKSAGLILCDFRSSKLTTNRLNPVLLKAQSTYYIAFNTIKGSIDPLEFILQFEPTDLQGVPVEDSLNLNLVSRYDQAVYALHIIDEKSKKPVIARIYISSTGNLDGSYRASDLRLNNTKNIKATLRIDAQGYFSKDLLEHKIVGNKSSHDTICLTPITSGAIAKLEDINFVGGMAVIADEALPKLKRLKDFLLLNPTISIEIQGHVNEEGKNSMSAHRLSKKRAEKIMKYLITKGIDAKRLKAVGFGNSKPLFENPIDDSQREANRRVEIKVN